MVSVSWRKSPFFAAAQMQEGAIVFPVNFLTGEVELPFHVAVGNRADLLDPPILLLVAVVAGATAGEDHRFDFELVLALFRVEYTVGEYKLVFGQKLGQHAGSIGITFVQVKGEAGEGVGGHESRKFPAIAGAQPKALIGPVEFGNVASYRVGKRKI